MYSQSARENNVSPTIHNIGGMIVLHMETVTTNKVRYISSLNTFMPTLETFSLVCNFWAFRHYDSVLEVKPWEGFPKFITFHSWDPKRNFVKLSKSIFPCSQYFIFRTHDAWTAALIVQHTEFISTVLPHTANDEGNGANLRNTDSTLLGRSAKKTQGQKNSGDHPDSYSMGTGDSCPRTKWPGRKAKHSSS
jgi:hypothetical protein